MLPHHYRVYDAEYTVMGEMPMPESWPVVIEVTQQTWVPYVVFYDETETVINSATVQLYGSFSIAEDMSVTQL